MPPQNVMPWQPEPVEDLRRRFPGALRPSYPSDGSKGIPALLRKHVFDFGETGVRMIVSTDQERDEPPVVHVSFGLFLGQPTPQIPCIESLAMWGKHLVGEWFTQKHPLEVVLTDRALHLWFAWNGT